MAKIAGVHQSVILSLTGSGAYTGGSIQVERVGNQVTITAIDNPTHASAISATSAVGLLPVWARPKLFITNTYSTSSSSGGFAARADVGPDGTFSTGYVNSSMVGVARTNANATISISYNV